LKRRNSTQTIHLDGYPGYTGCADEITPRPRTLPSIHPLQTIPDGAGLVTEPQTHSGPRQLLHKPPDGGLIRTNLPKIAKFTVPAALRNGNGMAILRDIQTDENFCMLFHGSSSWREDRLNEQPSLQCRQCRANHRTTGDEKGHTVLRQITNALNNEKNNAWKRHCAPP